MAAAHRHRAIANAGHKAWCSMPIPSTIRWRIEISGSFSLLFNTLTSASCVSSRAATLWLSLERASCSGQRPPPPLKSLRHLPKNFAMKKPRFRGADDAQCNGVCPYSSIALRYNSNMCQQRFTTCHCRDRPYLQACRTAVSPRLPSTPRKKRFALSLGLLSRDYEHRSPSGHSTRTAA
jgi:hypothetical protein